MFSVIMPTMWRSYRTVSLINSICSSTVVSELIIIDNNPKSRPRFDVDSKVVMIDQKENIYVNPAWNLGVKESNEDYICIINDDITMDCESVFPYVLNAVKKIPCIGIHSSSYNYKGAEILMTVGHDIGRGWGCCMFLDKRKWVDIPEQIKIWFGDNWIVKTYQDCASIVTSISTEMSTTSNDKQLSDVIKNDIEEWNKKK